MTDTHNVALATADGVVSCHDIVLVASSPVLKAMLSSTMQEGKSKSIQVEQFSLAGVSLLLDILYMSSTRSDPDCQATLEALALAHCWEVKSAVHVLADLLRSMLSEETFAAIAEAAVLHGPEALQRQCALFASENTQAGSSQNDYRIIMKYRPQHPLQSPASLGSPRTPVCKNSQVQTLALSPTAVAMLGLSNERPDDQCKTVRRRRVF